MLMEAKLKGRVALVTASSRGIGAAKAAGLARNGAKVALHGRDLAALQSTSAEIGRDGVEVMQVTGDVTKLNDLERMRRSVEEKLGPVDVLVANTGGSFTKPAPFEQIPEDGWRASLEGNLTATFLTIKCFLPGMKQRKSGVIITVSSSAGRRPSPMAPVPYAAAKAGIQILTQDLAAEPGPFGIRVNCIAPETILTERNRHYIPEQQKNSWAQAHPLKRLGTPDDIAQAALFLASDTASWITGVIFDVDGGMAVT